MQAELMQDAIQNRHNKVHHSDCVALWYIMNCAFKKGSSEFPEGNQMNTDSFYNKSLKRPSPIPSYEKEMLLRERSEVFTSA